MSALFGNALFDADAYYLRWQRVNDKMQAAGFSWGELHENGEWNQYMCLDIHTMPRRRFQRLMAVSAGLGALLDKAYRLIDEDIEAFMQLGLQPAAYDVKRIKNQGFFSAFARFDFAVQEDGIFLLEINSDTPTGYVEGATANPILCREAGVSCPNRVTEALAETWPGLLAEYRIPADETLYFSAYDWHNEDRETVQLLCRYCPHPHTEFIGIGDIVVSEQGLFTPRGAPIRFLYRLYPLEYLQDDIDERRRPIGHWFLRHIAEGRVTVFNPPSAFIMQSKAVQAVLYGWHKQGSEVFDAQEHALLARHLLPSYFTPQPFQQQCVPYVAKPFWGREGGGVSIHAPDGRVLAADNTRYYTAQPKIYQRYVELPQQQVTTWNGAYTGRMLTSVYLIGGKPAGVLLRVGEHITGNLSMFLGVTVGDD